MNNIAIFVSGNQTVEVRLEGARQVKRTLKHYNLDAIISVGYRVKSVQGTRFRQWARMIRCRGGFQTRPYETSRAARNRMKQAMV